MLIRLIKTVSLGIILFVFGIQIVTAQDILKSKDISTIKVDLLADADILRIRQQLSAARLTIDDVRPQLMLRGMTSTEYVKLKNRLESSTKKRNLTTGKYKVDDKKEVEKNTSIRKISGKEFDVNMLDEESEDSTMLEGTEMKQMALIDPRIFGSELFNKFNLNETKNAFEPNLKIATPLNYEIGPGDEIKLVLYGQQQYSEDLKISPEGQINILNVGVVKVGGLSIEAAQSRIKQLMSKAYPTLSNGSSKLSLTIGDIRTIHVTVIGANFAGSHDVPSLSTVYSVLSLAGGPKNIGSFRLIELVRNDKVIKVIDLYRLIAKGNQSDNVRLRDNDVIRIPSYTSRIELNGQVKRPGLFEVLPLESFKDILAFAGGFDDTAYTAMVKVIRKSSKERVVKDLGETDFNSFKPETGDMFVVSKILDRYSNRVKINGSVFRPDMYEFQSGMKISDLIAKADGLTEDAFLERGLLIRQKEDFTKEFLSFNVLKALQKDSKYDMLLKKEDELLISSVIDLKDSLLVTLQGEVHMPGEYNFIEGMTLKGLILQAGGFTDAASSNIEIAHLIARDSVSMNDTRVSIAETIQINDSLKFNDLDFAIKPYDVITIRKKPAYSKLETVLVDGQVQFPGPYALKDAQERVSSLFKRVGGLLPDASIDGAYLKRFKSEEEIKRISDATKRMQLLFADSTGSVLKDVEKEFDRIPIDLAYILLNPGTTQDVILKSRDELIIPKLDAQVRVSGAVLQSTQIPFEAGKSFRSYIYSAGGFSREAWRKRAYIVYANGKAAAVRTHFVFRKHPKVKPGSEIIVPKEPISKGNLSTGEVIGLSSALASLAGVVIAILKL
jgi:protein involved in polysaccharide export with SLBB domain